MIVQHAIFQFCTKLSRAHLFGFNYDVHFEIATVIIDCLVSDLLIFTIIV